MIGGSKRSYLVGLKMGGFAKHFAKFDAHEMKKVHFMRVDI